MLDLDHFKRVNNGHGHGAGDRVLRHFAEQARSQLRTTDLIGRIGGEEFLVILPETDLPDATALLDRLRVVLADSTPLSDCAPGLHCTVLIGVASGWPGDTPDSLVKRADKALYRAKASGRNRLIAAASGLGRQVPHHHGVA